MKRRTEIIKGKTKIIITRESSGIDRTKEAINYIMPEYEFPKEASKHLERNG